MNGTNFARCSQEALPYLNNGVAIGVGLKPFDFRFMLKGLRDRARCR